jgi:hypothetical protein
MGMLVGMYAGIIDGPALWLRSMLSIVFLTFVLHHLQIVTAIVKTIKPPITMPINSGVLKLPKVELDVEVGDVLELVGVGLEPAVAVTTPAPLLTAFPVTAGVAADPPEGVTEVPPYWFT